MRLVWDKWRATVVILLLLQDNNTLASTERLKHGSNAKDTVELQSSLQHVFPHSAVAVTQQPHDKARELLQANESETLPGPDNPVPAHGIRHVVSDGGQGEVTDPAALAFAVEAEAVQQQSIADRLPQAQTTLLQYQPSSRPVIDSARLKLAAAAQAERLLADTTQKAMGEDAIDVWPFVESPFQEALHECFGSSRLHRVCKYYNLLLWNGTLYYPTTDMATLATGPPKVPVSWVGLTPFDKMEFGQDDWLEVVTPQDLPFNWDTTPKLSMKEALFWKLTFQDNYGHLLGEHGPIIHNLMCSYLNRCTYSKEDLADFHILLGNSDETEVSMMPSASQEMFNCFAKRAPMLVNDMFFKDHIVVIGTLLAGIGPTCRGFPWCRPQFGRSPMVGNMVTTWQERMLSCTHQPPNLIAPADMLNVVIIDRHYSAGRSFLNLPDVLAHLQGKFPGMLNITVDKLEGKTLGQQAALYVNASIVIQTHGAALGNVIFLPRGAVVIDIVPENNEDKSPWVVYMCADFKPLFISPITIPPQKTVLQMAKVRRTKEWAMLTPYWRQRILREGVCPSDEDVDWQVDMYAACNFQWFLKSGNLVLDFNQVADAVQAGITHVQGVHVRMIDYVHKSYEFDLSAAVV